VHVEGQVVDDVIAEDALLDDGYAANGGAVEGDQATVMLGTEKRRRYQRAQVGIWGGTQR
jgi:hypothetical protein